MLDERAEADTRRFAERWIAASLRTTPLTEDDQRLHNDQGPAVVWSGKLEECDYYRHGVWIPQPESQSEEGS